jgi:Spy/CpxP family protein refolding chaperone
MAVLLAAGVSGLLVGVAIDRFLLPSPAVPRVSYGRPNFSLKPPSDADRRVMRDQLARDLGMTPDQRRQVDSIMNRRMRDFQTLREELAPRVESLITDVRLEIERILTPAQREKFRALQQEARRSE